MKKFLLLVIIGIGAAILYWCGCKLDQSREALKWPQTKGNVISSLLTVNHLPKFIDPRADPARWYGAQVQYIYTVGDEEYISDRLSFQKGDTPYAKEALKLMNKYRRQHEVTVYYNPKDQQEAVLQPGYIGGIYIPFFIGVFLFFGGLFSFYSKSIDFRLGGDDFIAKGNACLREGKFEDAIWEYTQFINARPNLVMGYNSRGRLYLQQKNWDKAIADFNRAIANDPMDASLYFFLANAYLGKEQFDNAWVNMQKAMERGFMVNPRILEDIKKKVSA